MFYEVTREVSNQLGNYRKIGEIVQDPSPELLAMCPDAFKPLDPIVDSSTEEEAAAEDVIDVREHVEQIEEVTGRSKFGIRKRNSNDAPVDDDDVIAASLEE